MKLYIKENKIDTYFSVIERYVDRVILKVSGYSINELELTIPNKDLTIDELLALSPIAAGYDDYPIWIEVPIALNDANIPATFSFSTYIDDDGNTVQRKISDMPISSAGTTNNIRYLQGHTSRATKSDIEAIVANPNVVALSLSERNALINDPNGEYYVEDII
jgi:hypothetical protein